MLQFKASSIKKQNLCTRERIKIRIFSTDIVLIVSTIIAYMLLFSAPINEAVAQTPYLNSKTASQLLKKKGLKEQDTDKEKNHTESKLPSLGIVLSVYQSLRENYEFRLRYDEAGTLFIKEMELKRNYRSASSQSGEDSRVEENNWLRRHFSLTGLYYHFSR